MGIGGSVLAVFGIIVGALIVIKKRRKDNRVRLRMADFTKFMFTPGTMLIEINSNV